MPTGDSLAAGGLPRGVCNNEGGPGPFAKADSENTMPPDPVACPFCNALIPAANGAASLVCPRCGESSGPARAAAPGSLATLSAQSSEHASLTAPTIAAAAEPVRVAKLVFSCAAMAAASLVLKLVLPESSTAQRAFPFMVLLSGIGMVAALWVWFLGRGRRTNAVVAGFVLGNMAAMVLMALPLALANTGFRRSNDPRAVAIADVTRPATPVPMAGLGYLPDDFNLAAGIDVAAMAADPAVAKQGLLGEADDGQRRMWLLEQGLGRVEKMTGLKADAVDHVVLGLKLDMGLPSLMVVAVTREDHDPQLIAKAQGSVVPVLHRNRTLYQFKTPPIGEGLLYSAGPRVLVMLFRLDALADRDRKLLTVAPRTGAEAAPAPLRALLKEVSVADRHVWWAASDVERPEAIATLLPFGENARNLDKQVGTLKAFVAGAVWKTKANVWCHVQCTDPKAAESLMQSYGRDQDAKSPAAPLRVAGPDSRPDGTAWVHFSMDGEPAAVTEVFKSIRFFGKMGKK
jgi:hypothetical protein